MLGDITLATSIYLITGYTDMRKSIDGLCAIILQQLKTEPDGHSIYLFCGKRCDRIKVLLREPDGYTLLYCLVHNKSTESCNQEFHKVAERLSQERAASKKRLPSRKSLPVIQKSIANIATNQ